MRHTYLLGFLISLVSLHSATGQEWTPLFDGLTLAGWVTSDGKQVRSPAWEVHDGMLHLDRSKGQGGNLLTDREYGDFELVFEWTIAEKANNGIKYRVKDFDDRTLGLEYQVIDDLNHPKLAANHRTAAIYDVYDATTHDLLRPAGEFNRGRIVVRNDHIEHWLNGHLVAEASVGSPEWQERIADSKFADVDGFGRNRVGRIMLTDHNDEVWYRNIFIREFPTAVASNCATRPIVRCSPQLFRRACFRRFRVR